MTACKHTCWKIFYPFPPFSKWQNGGLWKFTATARSHHVSHTAESQPSTGLHGVCGQESIQGGKHPPEDPTALKIHQSPQLCVHQLRYFKRTAFFTLSCKDERHFTSSEGEGWQVDLQSQQVSLLQEDRIVAAGRLPQLV